MVRHQAISIEMATLRKRFPCIINRIDHIPQDAKKTEVIVAVFKDVLPVSTSHHNMINTRSTYFS